MTRPKLVLCELWQEPIKNRRTGDWNSAWLCLFTVTNNSYEENFHCLDFDASELIARNAAYSQC